VQNHRDGAFTKLVIPAHNHSTPSQPYKSNHVFEITPSMLFDSLPCYSADSRDTSKLGLYMKIAWLKMLLIVGWSVPVSAAVPITLAGLLSWLAPVYTPPFIFITTGFVVGVFPWLLVTYVVTTKRFGIGWHWLVSTIASLMAVLFSNIALSDVVEYRHLADLIRSSCSMPAEETLTQLRYMAVSCGITSWLALASAAFTSTITAGAPLVLIGWSYRHFLRRSAHHA
jgi:hypothetical protein